MLGSYRGIFVALAGLALAGPSPPQEQPERAQAGQQVAPTPSPTSDYAAYPDVYAERCYQADYHDTADLCAQWRAAMAAEESASATSLGNAIDSVGALLSFVSIILVVIALGQTNKSLLLAHKDRVAATRRAIAQEEETSAALRAAKKGANAMAKVALALRHQLGLMSQTTETSKRIADTQERIFKMQMRAYVSVTTDNAVYQDRGVGLRFQAIPTLRNSGQTAAKSLAFKIRAAILAAPLPPNYAFPEAPLIGADGFLPPQEDRTVSGGTVDNFFPDGVVDDIRSRRGLGLYVWGKITYVDEFDIPHETNFGHSVFWVMLPDGSFRIQTEYLPGMNGAT